MIRQPRPGDVGRTRAEAVAAAASALLQTGGEQPPLLRDDPATPRPGELADADPEPVAAT
jgi:hypothetical protein